MILTISMRMCIFWDLRARIRTRTHTHSPPRTRAGKQTNSKGTRIQPRTTREARHKHTTGSGRKSSLAISPSEKSCPKIVVQRSSCPGLLPAVRSCTCCLCRGTATSNRYKQCAALCRRPVGKTITGRRPRKEVHMALQPCTQAGAGVLLKTTEGVQPNLKWQKKKSWSRSRPLT